MADNVSVTWAADDVASVWYPRVKIDVGGDGVTAPVTGSTGLPTVGTIADDAADSGAPHKVGAVARTTNRTAVADGDRVNLAADDMGRLVTVAGQVRDLVVQQTTAIANSTAETTILTAGAAGVFHDLTHMTITNATATAVVVTLRDATLGTAVGIYNVAASGGLTVSFTRPFKQTTAANNWTAQLSATGINVNFVVQAEKNV